MNIRRGDVFNINFGTRKGHEQEGLRPAIVVQNTLYCRLSTLWVIPTSTRAQSYRTYANWVRKAKGQRGERVKR